MFTWTTFGPKGHEGENGTKNPAASQRSFSAECFLPRVFLQAKRRLKETGRFPLAKFYNLASAVHSGDKRRNRIMLRPLIELPKQRKLNPRQCLHKTSQVKRETSRRTRELRALPSLGFCALGRGGSMRRAHARLGHRPGSPASRAPPFLSGWSGDRK